MKRTVLLIAACGLWSASLPAQQTTGATAANYLNQFVDSSAKPGDDFYKYAVGKWIKDHPIPADERSWGIAKVVQDETYARLQQLSEAAAAHPGDKGSSSQKIGDFWYSAMDTAAINRQGITPLRPEFDRIAAIKDREGVLDAAAHLQYLGAEPLFATYVFQDEKNSEAYALHLYQGGLGLPNRDYYFDDDERTTNIRSEYVKHVARMLELLGDDPATAAAGATTVMRMETSLAGASRRLAELRDPGKNYNRMTLEEASRLTPSIRWRSYLSTGHIENIDSVIVGQPEFFQQLEKSLADESVANWKTYLRWSLIHAYAAELGSNFEQENFRFYGTVLSGTPQMRPRWKRMLDEQELYLGDALGQLYVRDYFSAATKARYEKLTDDIFAAFAARIHRLDWMSTATKEAALRKLGTVNKKVGYPEKWKDYSSLEIGRDSFVANCMRGRVWHSEYEIQKLHRPVDRTEWSMTPQTYNAYYDPSKNEIVLPAAIFILPGIADPDIDDALVYAYAGGTTIGHEITHGFDDEGRQFDEQGNLREWWTAADAEEFNKRAQVIVKQFDGYVVVDNLHANGAATEGENIADLGGILLGWDAFQQTDEYRSGKSIGGYTPAQRYFIGWSLGWMNNVRPEALAMQVKVDVHAPSFLRVNGPVSNMPAFFEAFQVKPGDPMYRSQADMVRIW